MSERINKTHVIQLIFAVVAGVSITRLIDKFTGGYLARFEEALTDLLTAMFPEFQISVSLTLAFLKIAMVGISLILLAFLWKRISNYQENRIEIILTIIYASVPFAISHSAGLILYSLVFVFVPYYSSNLAMDLFFVSVYVFSLVFFESLYRKESLSRKIRSFFNTIRINIFRGKG